MVRANFERELQRLRDRILTLGSQVENNLVEAIDSLMNRDVDSAQRLIAGDRDVNEERIAIMNEALILIATQQPMAGDMRLIASVIEIAGELERINDYVKGIARITILIAPDPIPDVLGSLPTMAEKSREMLHAALDAASRRDADQAREIPDRDTEIDQLFNQIYKELIAYLVEEPDQIGRVNQLEWAAHNLERAADRVTNICEWVVYMATGEYIEMDSELEAPPPQN